MRTILLPSAVALAAAGEALAADAAVFAAAAKGGATPAGDPAPWLALASIAMVATLLLAHRLVTRPR